MSYTLRSQINGKYIGSLSSDGHIETFIEKDLLYACTWTDLEEVTQLCKELCDCDVINVQVESFRQDLKQLLDKHNVTLGVHVDGAEYGSYCQVTLEDRHGIVTTLLHDTSYISSEDL